MKKIYLFICVLFTISSQAQIPEPPGFSPYYFIDVDNDGYAPFDVELYMEEFKRPWLTNSFGQDVSGYDLYFYPFGVSSTTGSAVGPIYTNVIQYQENCNIEYVYNGNGPEWVVGPPANTVLASTGSVELIAVPHDGDMDSDGVLNELEDLNGNLAIFDDDTDGDGTPDATDADDDNDGIATIYEDYNGNGNYYDDDLNGDGIPDYRDASVALGIAQLDEQKFAVYPNPSNGILNLKNFTEGNISIFDIRGILVRKYTNPKQMLDISSLESGFYILKAETFNSKSTIKLIVE